MTALRRIALALAFFPFAAPAQQAAPESAAMPFPYRAEYEVQSDGKPAGRATVELSRDGIGQWVLTSHTRAEHGMAAMAGLDVRESSRFAFDPASGRFRSLDYRYRQNAAFRSRERSVAFDAENGRIVSRDRDREYRFDHRAGALDRQTVTLALARDLAQGRREGLSYLVADRERMAEQTYRFAGEETVATPAGRLAALKLEREREADQRRQTTSWLGVAQGYAPVRVVQTESNGSRFEMRLVKFKRLGAASGGE